MVVDRWEDRRFVDQAVLDVELYFGFWKKSNQNYNVLALEEESRKG
jgi:hypothetical protein